MRRYFRFQYLQKLILVFVAFIQFVNPLLSVASASTYSRPDEQPFSLVASWDAVTQSIGEAFTALFAAPQTDEPLTAIVPTASGEAANGQALLPFNPNEPVYIAERSHLKRSWNFWDDPSEV